MRKKRTGNESELIRSALETNPSMTPGEVSNLLKGQGHEISAQRISNVKSMTRNKNRKKGKSDKRLSFNPADFRHAVSRPSVNGLAAIGRALDFVQAAGSLHAAKAAISTLEEIGRVIGK